ncbi:hypothetical protein G6F58_011261 [Rhizopus delemar]|nr:hypothetical protein G6F58_011261 [Rhizopus delemar]
MYSSCTTWPTQKFIQRRQIEVLLGNTKSSRFSPKTGVLQGSILSPFLYPIYINQLPSLLRDCPLDPVPDAEPLHHLDFKRSYNNAKNTAINWVTVGILLNVQLWLLLKILSHIPYITLRSRDKILFLT